PFVVVFVEFGFEAWIRGVIRRRPFPNVADHLVAAVGAAALRHRAYRRDAPELTVEKVRPRHVGRRIAPRELLFGPLLRFEASRLLPFGFGGQPLPCPLGVGGRFKITDVRDRLGGLLSDAVQAVKIADHPSTVLLLPIKRGSPMLTIYP